MLISCWKSLSQVWSCYVGPNTKQGSIRKMWDLWFFYIDVRVMFNHVNQLVKLLAKICEPYIIVNIEGIPISNTKCNRLEARQSEYTDLLKKVQSLLRTHLGSRNNILRISGRKQPQSISGWFRRGELWGEHLNLRPVRKTRFKIIILLVIWC